MTLLANTAKDYVLEASARAELLDHPSTYPELGLQLNGGGSSFSRQESSQNLPLMLTMKSVRYEMPVLCFRFLGPWGRLVYMICLSVYIYGALLAYSSVFSKSCASTFPIPGVADSYAMYLALFALLVVPLSCLELTEQVSLQVALAGCRILLVVLMVGTVGAAYKSKTESFPGQSGECRPWLHAIPNSDRSIDELFDRSIDQTIIHSFIQWINEPVNRSINSTLHFPHNLLSTYRTQAPRASRCGTWAACTSSCPSPATPSFIITASRG